MAKVVIPYTPLTGDHVEIHKQLEAHRFAVLVCHRRFGKTVLLVNHIGKMAAMNKRKRPQYAYICPKANQAERNVWTYFKEFFGQIPGIRFRNDKLIIEWPNGVRIFLLGADNDRQIDSIRGMYLDGCVIDETAQVHPDLYDEVIRPALSDRQGWCVFSGTPKGRGWFFNQFTNAAERDGWWQGYYPASRTTVFGGFIPAHELELARADMQEDKFNQEYECSWDADTESILIPYKLIEPALTRVVGYKHAPIVAGLDVGLSLGGDPSALVIRQGGQVRHMETRHFDDYGPIAGWVYERMMEHDCCTVAVDSIGWGAGAAYALETNYPNLSVHRENVGESAAYAEKYNRRRDELWFACREWFEEKQCALARDHKLNAQLIEELTGVTYDFTKSNKIRIMDKPTMKKKFGRSPDLADALCLTFACPGSMTAQHYGIDSRKPRFIAA